MRFGAVSLAASAEGGAGANADAAAKFMLENMDAIRDELSAKIKASEDRLVGHFDSVRHVKVPSEVLIYGLLLGLPWWREFIEDVKACHVAVLAELEVMQKNYQLYQAILNVQAARAEAAAGPAREGASEGEEAERAGVLAAAARVRQKAARLGAQIEQLQKQMEGNQRRSLEVADKGRELLARRDTLLFVTGILARGFAFQFLLPALVAASYALSRAAAGGAASMGDDAAALAAMQEAEAWWRSWRVPAAAAGLLWLVSGPMMFAVGVLTASWEPGRLGGPLGMAELERNKELVRRKGEFLHPNRAVGRALADLMNSVFDLRER
eukprot:tig00000241_g21001.t1